MSNQLGKWPPFVRGIIVPTMQTGALRYLEFNGIAIGVELSIQKVQKQLVTLNIGHVYGDELDA